MIRNRRNPMWRKHINDTYKNCDKNIKYNQKNAYIEDRIEFVQSYFSYINDLNHKGKEALKMKKKITKLQKKVANVNVYKHKTDTLEFLKKTTLKDSQSNE